MRRRVLLLVSFGLNLFLALALVVYQRGAARKMAASDRALALVTNQVQTNVVVRRQFFTWREIESPDYPTYIANLHAIGCPESTVRDIIVADVNQLYALKRDTEVVTPSQLWWHDEGDAEVARAAGEKIRALDAERRALLTRLLGPNWEVAEMVSARPASPPQVSVVLDGTILGVLPAEVKRAVREISARSQQRIQAYIDAERKAGRQPDPAELARLRQQTRNELAQVLTPPQLEEFLLRYSETAHKLRTDLSRLTYFNATPDEFRSLFRAYDTFDQQINLYYSGNDPATAAMRKSLEQQRDAAIKNALGPERYEQYVRLQDPAYRDAMAAALKAGVPEAAQTIYEVGQATALEQSRVKADTNLTAQQKEIELKRIELEQAKANALAMGQELPPEPQPPVPPPIQHVIEPGETIDKLAARYGVSIRDILRANVNVDFSTLKPGDSVLVPSAPATK
jgi:LysM repeat protein